ncbi:RecT protein precursor [Hydrogenophaga intermedia]|uniref:RecT protein n=1 Tax=Hydrogenophaga intermedia TaxID=65786 RepID=A0A1L1PMV9_HYDIT|nr:RecT family recombinase [Hydrogenophaga intermedia]CDN87376.1 RecT protein precursor [Hydrogenophaga intermedia]
MNHTQTEAGALATAEHFSPPPVPSTVISSSALVLDNASMDKMLRVAEVMASGRSTIPKHLQGNVGDCMAVVMQAVQWNMNPYAVAQKTHLVNGTLGYEAQLVAAVINNSPLVRDRFNFEWFGDWTKVIGRFVEKESKRNPGEKYRAPGWVLADEKGLGVKVWATIKGEPAPRVLELLLSQAGVRNSTLWADDPKQQLAYLAQKRWARLHAPDVILGVYTPDELQESVPRDMGPAEVVSEWHPDLRAQAEEAAAKGAAAYGAFWKLLPRELQQKLAKTPEHDRFKDQAQAADRERTVDSPAPAPAPAPAAATTTNTSTGEITTTFAEVEAKLRAARTVDALAVALDWSNALAPEEQHRAGELLDLHDQLKAAMQKGGAK